MTGSSCDVLIVGGGVGGCAAALAACDLGLKVVLTEESDWVGGQLTAQEVPPDEHKWIEEFGCTRRYRSYRNRVRRFYRENLRLAPDIALDPTFNPGGGWVSNLCHSPAIGHRVLLDMLESHVADGSLQIRLGTIAAGASQLCLPPIPTDPVIEVRGDTIRSIALHNLDTGEIEVVRARFFLDATELGDLLPLTGTEYVTGSEGRDRTGEPHAHEGPDRPDNQQALTWVFAMAHDPGSNRIIDRPKGYDRWHTYRPPFWPGPFLSTDDIDPVTLQARHIPLFSDDWQCWFKYRQVVDPTRTLDSPFPVTIVNWPQNDYFIEPIIDVDPDSRWERLMDAKELSLCLLYWLQTECPRADGGTGYPGLFMSGADDGFAKTPYIRESRRLAARRTVTEFDVSSELAPAPMADSVGVGSYRVDLHPSTGGDSYIDLATVPFQIPLGALVPERTRNLLPACKNIGTTHITNGCYRLHPVEWNIGEAAGLLSAFCVREGSEPHRVAESEPLFEKFQDLLHGQGVETFWPGNL